ncbi:MAG: TetR/AcrR family transcriptional regulator [Burkholderiales bacterium]|jgi:AcrR family transcriptional regulator|nr:TetR/AcrR family transcriptional regulator [Burkholderiales bacterium]
MVDTEQTILRAAKAVFLKKGLDAASMNDIAQATGMSRTLLHYYYRKKESLFRAILINTVGEIIPKINTIIETDLPLIVKIERVFDVYLNLLLEDPMYPHFLLVEIQRDPGALIGLIRSHGNNFGSLAKIEQQLRDECTIALPEKNPLAHLFVCIYAPLIFPFLVRPALNEVFFNNHKDAFSRFMREHKSVAITTLKSMFRTPVKITTEKKSAVPKKRATSSVKREKLTPSPQSL